MKSILSLCCSVLLSSALSAQPKPVKWTVELSTDDAGQQVILATATIDEGWHLYSQHTDPDGPVPTAFAYEGVTQDGPTEELSKAVEAYSDLFDLVVRHFDKQAIFQQKISPLQGAETATITITYMCCDGDKCLPPTDEEFTIRL